MRTALLIGLALVASLLVVPGVNAGPPGGGDPPSLCDFFAGTWCDIPERLLEDLDPRNWPCTCDPQPDPI